MLVDGIIISAPHQAILGRLQLPDPAPTDVVVRVTSCALCTWEQRVYRGKKPTYPFWGGHEVCGVVENIGRDAQCRLQPGDFVALALMNRCGTCRYCRAGLDNHCAYLHPRDSDGLPSGPRGLSTHVVATANQTIPVDVRLQHGGALIEPLACTLRSIRRSRVKPGQLAVVIGTGTLGLLHVSALTTTGVRVLACDPGHPATAQLEKAHVQDTLLGNIEEIVAAVERYGGADCVFCIRGGPQWINAAIAMCARGGTVVLFQSIPDSDLTTLRMNDLHQREISLVGTISQRLEDFFQASELTAFNPSLFDLLATVTVSHHEPQAAFEKSLDPSINRVLVTFTA
jgi:L-iditol 2-dehydrogenase